MLSKLKTTAYADGSDVIVAITTSEKMGFLFMNGFHQISQNESNWNEVESEIWKDPDFKKYAGRGYKFLVFVANRNKHYQELNTWIAR